MAWSTTLSDGRNLSYTDRAGRTPQSNRIYEENTIQVKRLFLPFLALLSIIALDEVRNYVYLPFVVGIVCFILFTNLLIT